MSGAGKTGKGQQEKGLSVLRKAKHEGAKETGKRFEPRTRELPSSQQIFWKYNVCTNCEGPVGIFNFVQRGRQQGSAGGREIVKGRMEQGAIRTLKTRGQKHAITIDACNWNDQRES